MTTPVMQAHAYVTPEKKSTKEASSKKRKEDLDKAASNLELVELAVAKSSFQTTPSGMRTPSKVVRVEDDNHRESYQIETTPRRSPRLKGTLDRPSVATSAVLGSAFRALDGTLASPSSSTELTQLRNRLEYQEKWLNNLQQQVNQQREFINWMYNEQSRNMYHYSSPPSSSSSSQLSTNMSPSSSLPASNITSSSQTPVATPSTYDQPAAVIPYSPEPSNVTQSSRDESEGKIFTKDQLRNLIKDIHDFSRASRTLFRRLYSAQEMAGRSLKGQKPNKNKTAKPPLANQQKLELLYEVIQEKWPLASKPMINSRLADVMKPSVNRI